MPNACSRYALMWRLLSCGWLGNKVYQLGRLAAEFLQVDVKGIVRAVHLAAVMNKIGHLDVEQQRLIGILHIEGVETSAFGNPDMLVSSRKFFW